MPKKNHAIECTFQSLLKYKEMAASELRTQLELLFKSGYNTGYNTAKRKLGIRSPYVKQGRLPIGEDE